MATVGEAHILVKAVTTGFDQSLRRQLKGIAGSVAPDGRAAGESLGHAFNRGFNRSVGNVFTKVAEGLRTMYPEAEQARLAFRSLVRTGYTLGTALTVVVGGISAIIGGLVVLIAALGRALPAVAGLASAFLQMRLAISFVQFALGGVGAAVSAATKQNKGLGKSIAEVTEEFQQLQFQAEEAALSETRAALNLEKALEQLRLSADLPPNSRARREAELAYEEAELAYRKAKDRTKDLNEEVAKGPQALNKAGGADPYADLTESQKQFAKFLVTLNPKLDELKEAVASGFLPVLQTQIQNLVDLYFPDLLQSFKDIGKALGVGAGNFFDNFLSEDTKKEVDTFLNNLEKNIPIIGEIFGELGEVLLKVFNDADGIGTKFLEFIRDTLIDWNTYLDEFGLEGTFENAFSIGSRLFGIIGNTLDGLGDFFALLDGEGGAIDILLTYLEGITSGFAALGDEGNPAAQSVSDTFAGLASNFGPVMNFIGALVNSFLELGANPAIGEFFNKLTSPENAANWDAIFESFANAGPALGDLVLTIGELFAAFADEGAPTAFFETLNTLIKPIAEFFGSDQVKPFIDDIGRLFAIITAATFVFEQIKFFFLVIIGNAIAFFGTIGLIFSGFKRLKNFIPKVFLGLKSIFETIIIRFLYFKDFLIKTLLPIAVRVFTAIGGLFRFLGGPWGILIGLIITGLTWFFTQTEIGKELFAGFWEFIKNGFEGLVSIFNTVADFLSDLFNDPVGTLQKLWVVLMNFLIDRAEGFINFFIDGINGLFGGLRDFGNLIAKALGIPVEFRPIAKVSLPRLPALAEGGVVMPSPGGTIAQIAEAGRPERVEPLDEKGLSKRDYAILDAVRLGGGMTINVYPSAGMDERELANMVSRRIATEIRRGTI